MTKRLTSKHKVDRRLKSTCGEDPKVHSTLEIIHQVNMESHEGGKYQIMAHNWKLNKN